MGNMLESDSGSTSSSEEAPEERVVVGQEEDTSQQKADHHHSQQLASSSSTVEEGVETSSMDRNANTIHQVPSPGPIAVGHGATTMIISSSSSLSSTMSTGAAASMTKTHLLKSPTQLPLNKDCVIPIKPPRLSRMAPPSSTSFHNNSNNHSYNSNDSNNQSVMMMSSMQQKNPKFVPYEPYSCATRPIVSTTTNKSHQAQRKPSSDSGSNASTSASSTPIPPPTPTNSASVTFSPSTSSALLLKERLKMAEKALGEAQSENTRLKKLFVDSILGSPTQCMNHESNHSPSSQDQANHHHQNNHDDAVDNLTDKLEVWRSKFLSSCVLVEQLTKDNGSLVSFVTEAAVIIKDLKNSTSVHTLTPQQYETVNDWLRRTNGVVQAQSQASSSSDY